MSSYVSRNYGEDEVENEGQIREQSRKCGSIAEFWKMVTNCNPTRVAVSIFSDVPYGRCRYTCRHQHHRHYLCHNFHRPVIEISIYCHRIAKKYFVFANNNDYQPENA